MKRFPAYRQLDSMDCGTTCLRMICKYFGKEYSRDQLNSMSSLSREGSSLLGLSNAAEKIGFRTTAARISFEQLDEDISLPCILYWNNSHFVVLPPQNYDRNKANRKIQIADPAYGLVKIDKTSFLANWTGNKSDTGIVLMLEPTPDFYQQKEEHPTNKRGFTFLFQYYRPFKSKILQLLIWMIVGSLLSLIFPFLTQRLVDYGINRQNIGYIKLILLSQLLLFIGSTVVEIIRNWILLHMNSRINISIISDFLAKLMKLPIRFFDTRLVGDITQRINDHNRIEHFLTGSALTTLVSFISLIVFASVLGIYSGTILLIFILGSFLSVSWIFIFLKKRKETDYKRFEQLSVNQNNIFEIITGMQEIKLNNCESSKRMQWEGIQAKLFKLNIKSLTIGQAQQSGSMALTQIKNIFISYICAREVVGGSMTLGMMLSVSYIIGQMNNPISQLINFFQEAQDARISLERLGEIHNHGNEEKEINDISNQQKTGASLQHTDIKLENVSFRYDGSGSALILEKINLLIAKGKVTAIVGTSGSGKTTLLKLLLQFYPPTEGEIKIGNLPLLSISPPAWRRHCGVVMQEGFIFSDTIAKNIAITEEPIDEIKLQNAMSVSNIIDFVANLPLGHATKIGNSGNGISSGQKQRILIARAVYRNPDYLFFDEATSSLDGNNEKAILENLAGFFKGKTVVVIAHRLSTVKTADMIVVLDKGRIAETGDHYSLIKQRGKYFELIKNQLEIAN
jgi:ATP-binding cassette, subfamily B, bacterial